MATKFLNIDEIVPDSQILSIKGREFDISKTPAKYTAELLKVGSWAASSEVKGDPSMVFEAYQTELKALVAVLGKDQEGNTVTLEWLNNNVNVAQLTAIVDFVGECLGGESKQVAPGETPADFTQNRAQRRKAARKN